LLTYIAVKRIRHTTEHCPLQIQRTFCIDNNQSTNHLFTYWFIQN